MIDRRGALVFGGLMLLSLLSAGAWILLQTTGSSSLAGGHDPPENGAPISDGVPTDATQMRQVIESMLDRSVFSKQMAAPAELGAEAEPTIQAIASTYGQVARMHQWSVELAGIESSGTPETKQESLKAMLEKIDETELSQKEKDWIELARNRLDHWDEVNKALKLVNSAEQAYAKQDYANCLEYIRQLDEYPSSPAAPWPPEVLAARDRLTDILSTAEEMNVLITAYEQLSEDRNERARALKQLLDEYQPGKSARAKAWLLDKKREWDQLAVKLFIESYETQALAIRLQGVKRVYETCRTSEARELLRLTLKRWLFDVLQLRSKPDQIGAGIQQALVVQRAQLLVGVFRPNPQDPQVYFWWEELELAIKNSTKPQETVTVNPNHKTVRMHIDGAPHDPVVLSYVDRYNAQVRKTRADVLSRSAWEALLKLCGTLERQSSLYRDLASGDGGVLPAKYTDDYRELGFGQELQTTQEVIDHFDSIQAVFDSSTDE